MRNTTVTEILARDRQHRFADEATRYRQLHELPTTGWSPLRIGVGWMLVRTGLRLARGDAGFPAPTTVAGS
jgi:hypothetical protein